MPRRRRRCPILRIPKVGGDNGNGSRTKARKRCNVGRTNRKNAHPFYSAKVLREVDAEGQAAIEGDNVQVLLDHNLIGETEKLRKIPKTMAERHAVALLRLQKRLSDANDNYGSSDTESGSESELQQKEMQ